MKKPESFMPSTPQTAAPGVTEVRFGCPTSTAVTSNAALLAPRRWRPSQNLDSCLFGLEVGWPPVD